MEPTLALIRERFGHLIVGEGADDVPEAVVAQLKRTGRTLATAESCTGGLIARMITAIAGVSPYYPGRRRHLRQRGEGRAARRRPGADRRARGRQRRGRRGDGGGRPRRGSGPTSASP